jgi:hypothetical protein
MFFERHGVDWSISLVDADTASVPGPGIGHDERVAMLQANRTLRASELGKRLGVTTHYGPTYFLIISA